MGRKFKPKSKLKFEPEPELIKKPEPIIHTPASIMTEYEELLKYKLERFAHMYYDDINCDEEYCEDYYSEKFQTKLNADINDLTVRTLSNLRPEIKVNVFCKQPVGETILRDVYAYVDTFSCSFYELYPHFMIDAIYIDIVFDETGNHTINDGFVLNKKNTNELFKYVSLSYHDEVIMMSKMDLSTFEKIYLSKEKMFKLNLKNNLDELKIMPIEIGQSNISFVGEDYRETMQDFYSKANVL